MLSEPVPSAESEGGGGRVNQYSGTQKRLVAGVSVAV